MPLGGLRQKQVGHGSLGPKPGPVRIEETPAQTGHLTSVKGKAEQGTQAEQVGGARSTFLGTRVEAWGACSQKSLHAMEPGHLSP